MDRSRSLKQLVIPNPRSLRVRAALILVAVTLLPLIFVAVAGRLDWFSGERLLRTVRDASEQSAAVLTTSPRDEWDQELSAIARGQRMRIRVLDAGGGVMLDLDHQEPGLVDEAMQPKRSEELRQLEELLGPVGARPEVASARRDGLAADCRTTAGGEQLLCHSVRRLDGDGPHLVYVQDTAPRDIRTLYESRYSLARVTLFVLPAVVLLALWLGWRLVRPVEELRRQVQDKALQASPGARLELPGGDEFGDLAESFNGLLERLDERSAANQAFVADLAHEFKNPVAAIRTAAESLESGAQDPQRAARLARVLGDSATRLEVLLDQFLALARAEAGLPGEPRQAVDLGQLAAALVEAQEISCPQVTFATEIAADARVDGVAHELESALRNLLDNAASFAPQGTIAVVVRPVEGDIEVGITDDGPGIAAGDADRVFDRFFSTRAGHRGTGLGLALVRAVVEAHGGRVWVDPEQSPGAAFRLRIPAAAQSTSAAMRSSR